MINIVLIDDDNGRKDEIISHLSSQKDLVIQGMGKDNYDAIMLVKKFKPDIMLFDTALIYNNGIEIFCSLKRYSPDTAVVILCSSIKDSLIQCMAKGSITGCLHKDYDMERLPIILRGISKGEYYVHSMITARAFQILGGLLNRKIPEHTAKVKQPPPLADFSRTELMVLNHVAKGLSSNEIAKTLGYKAGSIRNTVSSVMHKTGLKTRTQMLLFAQENGFGNLA